MIGETMWRIVDVELGRVDLRLIARHRRLVLRDEKHLILDLLMGDRILLDQRLVAREIGLRLLVERRVLGELALRLRQRRLEGASSIWARKSPSLTIWPSSKPTCISLPAICVLTVTVASGVTVPSASIVIGMSPRTAAAARTVCGGGPGARRGRDGSSVAGPIFSSRSPSAISAAASETASAILPSR